VQKLPSWHALPHDPQLKVSDWRLLQLPSQSVSPAEQVFVVHEPLVHTVPSAHVFPHPPQFEGSLSMSMHCPEHIP